VGVVAHHGVGTDVDGEKAGQEVQPVFYPLSAVFVAFLGIGIDTA
jgi:hypothetical protein